MTTCHLLPYAPFPLPPSPCLVENIVSSPDGSMLQIFTCPKPHNAAKLVLLLYKFVSLSPLFCKLSLPRQILILRRG